MEVEKKHFSFLSKGYFLYRWNSKSKRKHSPPSLPLPPWRESATKASGSLLGVSQTRANCSGHLPQRNGRAEPSETEPRRQREVAPAPPSHAAHALTKPSGGRVARPLTWPSQARGASPRAEQWAQPGGGRVGGSRPLAPGLQRSGRYQRVHTARSPADGPEMIQNQCAIRFNLPPKQYQLNLSVSNMLKGNHRFPDDFFTLLNFKCSVNWLKIHRF